ncbi:multidrug ABC transporter ATP-binding protein [Campylobacter fetus subsp. testudinum]|uniref:Multidrug ABC transporter ATP-binding protein n=1 Tax=Campylobacter fetus subsp. testudinum TaxID=1507806 RepID=A0AAX0HBH5_CAMFE|nr:ATP-binding cassette domain-containing protein [Campylobacter fetus]OCR90885.1 multidrug ABC transporter ATP-binding protein [Campylobacter fetus subsp. testudinum]OCR96078.1 multidrug ABC transporter ATP-binding protein [Campylobacter fetus subsp. testudinum]OCS02066.1 multidrug ABC transporter ATP-binding protein [Campylobacter fetus subsp. testudinum]
MIKATNLTKNFDKPFTEALKSINFDAIKGKITGVVGPDGSGKTTLLRLCAGLLTLSSGELNVLGYKMPCSQKDFLNKIGYMPQIFGLYEDLTCEENLNLYAKLQDVQRPKQRIDEILEFTNLKIFKDRLARSLSGGMKQKLAFGATLLKKPELLLLDEPGVGVDPISREEIWSMAKSLTGVSILWATSYLDEASLCDKVLLINDGKIIFDDDPKRINNILENRVFLVEVKGDKKAFLTNILEHDNVLDAYFVGSKIRVVLKTKDCSLFQDFTDFKFENVTPSFEDAFVDMLKIKTKAHSKLTDILNRVDEQDCFAIKAVGLTKKFGSFIATNNISFEISKGEIFGFLGPNGAGKSTTFKMICGLLSRSEGESLIYGNSIDVMKNKIGYMAQKFSLYGNLGLKDNLDFFAGLYGLRGKEKRDKISSMIEIFGFDKYLQNRVFELPLGIKQRLALSCALMHSPLVLFLDEATSGVDPITRKEFWRHINAISNLGISVMVTTHLMDEAELCDRVMIIDKGKMIAVGTPDELKQKVGAISVKDAFIKLIKGANEL